MMVKEHHTPKGLLNRARRESRPKVARRLQVVVLAQKGLPGAKVADLTGESERTVRRWVCRYNRGGIEGLADRPRPGQPTKLARDREAAFRQRLGAGPTEADGRSVLHGRDIQRILAEEFQALYTLSGVYQLLHRLGYSWLMPRPRHENAAPEAQEAFKKNS